MSFDVTHRLEGARGRAGVIRTPHGDVETPAFVVVGTKATVKAVVPEAVADLGAQAVLANAYHLYLQPGADLIDEAGGLGRFMNWTGPTFTDSGGFQVMSLGAGFKKVLAMDTGGLQDDDVIAEGKTRMAHVDEDGVTFKSHLDGTLHRFTPEVSMGIQHQLGADIMFAFDELTTLMNTRAYQEASDEIWVASFYGGLPATRELDYQNSAALKANDRFPTTRVAVVGRTNGMGPIATAEAAGHGAGRLQPLDRFAAGRMTAIATAEVYFRRPPQDLNRVEYASLYSPYWQVRLVETPAAWRLLAAEAYP